MSKCWERNVGLTSEGYSQVSLDGKNHLAHRVSYRLFVGPIPKGKLVMHSCDNRKCFNPAHLSTGAHKSNTQDAKAKGRLAFGQRHAQSLLSDKKVLRLRKLWNQGWTATSLATEFSISKSCAWNAATRKTWRHIT